MNTDERINLFKRELSYFASENFKEFAKILIENADDYFFTVPASSSGKYHPDFARGNGGLVRHSKAVAYFANELIRPSLEFGKITRDEADCILLGALVHDIKKQGDGIEGHTVKEHPLLAAQYVYKTWEEQGQDLLTESQVNYTTKVIESHMGPWQAPCPETRPELIVFYADYIASRKEIVGLDFIDNEDNSEVGAYEKPVFTVEGYKFDFSKVKGLTIKEAYEKEPGLIRWMANKEGFGNVEVQNLIREFLKTI